MLTRYDYVLFGALLVLIALIAFQHLVTSAAIAEAQCLRHGNTMDTCNAVLR